MTAVIFSVLIFTYVTVVGTMDGFAILWTTLIPLIVCCYFNVRYGIFLFLYFELLFCVLFYSPLRQFMAVHYSDAMMNRYPILYFSLGIITSYFMIQYHKSVLDQMDYSEQLQKSKEEADRSNAAKSDFLANMSHEIRTPINAVLGMNEMILRESLRARDMLPENREVIREIFSGIGVCAGNIDSAGNSLLSIINDILDFSKIEAGKMVIVENPYKLSSVLNDVSNMIGYKAMDKGLSFRIDVDRTLPDNLYGDEVRVRQVIVNILNNAVKYTREGSVEFSVQQEPCPSSGDDRKICLVISVTDTGIGIKKPDLDRLFNKFERVDLQQNSTVEGTGLGLVITRSLLDMMNGTIDVESVYGKGSVFRITLPQKVVSEEQVGDFHKRFEESIREMHAYEETFHAPDARILIVDDTRMNLTVAVGLLKTTQIKIETAFSGAEAVSLAAQNHYDLILMDQRMPGMDGSEALHLIREQKDGRCKNVPVICLTADAVIGARERYLAEGFSDYLTKPIDSRALEAMLIRYLPEELVQFEKEPGQNAGNGTGQGMDQDTIQALPTVTGSAGSAEDVFSRLREAGINVGNGLQYCQNDENLYRSILDEYLHSAGPRKQVLQSCYETADWKNYGISVHALKSTSRTIGAEALSETAAALEAAANRKDEEYIQKEHEGMLQAYGLLTDALTALLGDTDTEVRDEEILEFSPEDEEILEFPPEDEEIPESPPEDEGIPEFAREGEEAPEFPPEDEELPEFPPQDEEILEFPPEEE